VLRKQLPFYPCHIGKIKVDAFSMKTNKERDPVDSTERKENIF